MIEPAGTRHYQRRVNPDNRTPLGEFQFNVGVIGATGYIGAPLTGVKSRSIRMSTSSSSPHRTRCITRP